MNEHEQKVLLQIVEVLLEEIQDHKPDLYRECMKGIARIKRGMADRKNFEETH